MITISGVPYNNSLTAEQKQQRQPSGVYPSGEAHFFDFTQDRSYHDGSGINSIYPNPEDFVKGSGLFHSEQTQVDVGNVPQSGLFSYNNLISIFSNVSEVSGLKITDFDNFGPYIHYYHGDSVNVKYTGPIEIPYVSTYKVSVTYNPYG